MCVCVCVPRGVVGWIPLIVCALELVCVMFRQCASPLTHTMSLPARTYPSLPHSSSSPLQSTDMQTSQGRQLEARLVAAAARKEALEQEYLVKKKTLEMLPDATENLRKLQGICAESAKKLMELGAEWEQHRRPLIAEQRHLVESRGQRKDRCRQKVRTRVSADGG